MPHWCKEEEEEWSPVLLGAHLFNVLLGSMAQPGLLFWALPWVAWLSTRSPCRRLASGRLKAHTDPFAFTLITPQTQVHHCKQGPLRHFLFVFPCDISYVFNLFQRGTNSFKSEKCHCY